MGDNTKGTMAEMRADGGLIFGPHSTTLWIDHVPAEAWAQGHVAEGVVSS